MLHRVDKKKRQSSLKTRLKMRALTAVALRGEERLIVRGLEGVKGALRGAREALHESGGKSEILYIRGQILLVLPIK
jgi:hypothetical protein